MSYTGPYAGTIWTGNGDPLTPGVPSVDKAPRLSTKDSYDPTMTYNAPLPAIPCMPLSWGDALPLLTALSGSTPAPAAWVGGLNITYYLGPGPATVRIAVQLDNPRKTIWNVIAKIPGSVEPDRYVLVGNHRDAWTFGAVDPNSGTAPMIEMGRALGAMYRDGWRPRRSVWMCSWDAEEYGLIGSVEFVEENEHMLIHNAVAYLNVDLGVSGTPLLFIDGVPSLSALVTAASKTVPAPPVSSVILDVFVLFPLLADIMILSQDPRCTACRRAANAQSLYDLWALTNPDVYSGQFVINAVDLGTGSDYGGFLQHTGVPIMHLTFSAEEEAYEGVYHSNYDSFYWVSHFGDPSFEYHAALARLWGVLTLRLADSPILPFSFTPYAQVLNASVYALQNSTAPYNISVDTMIASVQAVLTTAAALDQQLGSTSFVNVVLADPLQLRRLNDQLMLAERSLLFLQGIPQRTWYRHMVWATGQFDGYQSGAFSPVLDYVTLKQYQQAQDQVSLVSIVLDRFTTAMTLL